MALWYGLEDGYLRIELNHGSVLVVAASWEGGTSSLKLILETREPCSRRVWGLSRQRENP